MATKNAAAMPAAPALTMAEALDQTERSFMKQEGVFLATKNKRSISKLRNKKGFLRYHCNIGLGFKTPEKAKIDTYVDKKCPFTGNVSIRGRILKGICVSSKMRRTIIVRRDYLHFIRKYKRYEKRHTNIPAHCSPAFTVKDGDVVVVGQCRPLSKTVRFNVVSVENQSDTKPLSIKKQFRM
jgi:small subunit ribosomal protein S11e